MVERLGRLIDLELWRDIRASKIEGARAGVLTILWVIDRYNGAHYVRWRE